MTTVAEIANENEYAELLSRTLPHVIHIQLGAVLRPSC
jgi:hypothetical protein